MTLHKPSIFLSRLLIHASGRSVYDQKFREGVNVLYGENASGKSTILDFIFFVLGGESPRWKPPALRCENVIAEVLVNGEALTLSRAVSEARQQPLSIYWGPVQEALESAAEGWETYPYRRTNNKDSFSQVLFKALEMPEVPADDSSNITMHQILRLIYEDQMSSPEDMFRHDEFDRELTKETVGELLCGVYDPKLYSDQLRLRELDKTYLEAQAELRSLFSALGTIGDDLSLSSVEEELRKTLEERDRIYNEIERLSTKSEEEENGEEAREDHRKLRYEILSLGREIVELEQQSESLGFQLAEAEEFINTLEGNLEALKQSELTHLELGAISFSFCPACFAPIAEEKDGDTCPLCKTPIDRAEKRPHQLRMRREIEMQIRESESIQSDRDKQKLEVEMRLKQIQSRRNQLTTQYRAKRTLPISRHEEMLQELYERVGWLNRQAEVLTQRIEIASKVDQLSQRKAALNAERSELMDHIAAAKRAQEKQRSKAYTLLSRITRELLNSDLEREDSFISAKHVDFSFGKERITVDGQSRFAASSSVYLKNSFALGLLLASLEDEMFRFPRLLILDGIEDKGMEEDRIHHFQNLMVDRSSSSQVQHQIIFTAQTLSMNLVDQGLVVGKRYTHSEKTLKI